MTVFQLSAIVLTLAALFSYINHRHIKLPTTIGVMLIAQVLSLLLLVAGAFVPQLSLTLREFVIDLHFDDALLEGMLGTLLFAGALHINLGDLRKQAWPVATFASVGILISTALIGSAFMLVCSLLSIPMTWIHALLFGALISPTDPIAVLGLLKKMKAPKWLETMIAGESLFNDGVGVVIFLALYEVAFEHHDFTTEFVLTLFVQEAIGGAIFGYVVGFAAYSLIKRVDNYQVEILLSLATAIGGYAAAMAMHLSGPIAMVVAGLLLGNKGRFLAMGDETISRLDHFWELIDEILNVVLFLLLGLELLILDFQRAYLVLGTAMIVGVLLGRLISIQTLLLILRRFRPYSRGTGRIMVWGGLRGGISVALALSIPSSAGEVRDVLLTATYLVVTFSIIVQGLTISRLLHRIELT